MAGWLPHPGWGVRVWAAGVRRGHDRFGRAKSRPEAGARHAHGRRTRGFRAEGHRARRGCARRRGRDSRLLLRAAARAACRSLPDVPLRGCAGTAEAAGRLHPDRRRGNGGQDRAHLGDGGRGAERDARVHSRQPPARLPGLRQGRRVPAPGPDVPLRAGKHPDGVREAHVREADPDLPDDRPRPRALHPLLPLHALLGVRRRGRPARRGRARRRVDDRHLRRRALPRPVLRQRDRAVPGRRAHLDPVPLRGPPVGDPERPDGLRALPRRLQHQRHDPRGQGQADHLAQPPGDRRGLALRQGSLRLLAPARRRPDPGSAREDRRRVRAARVDRRARQGRGDAPGGRHGDPHRALRLRDRRAGIRARAASPLRPRRTRRRHARGRSRTGSTPSARRSRRSAMRRPSSFSARSPSSSARPSSTSGSRPRGETVHTWSPSCPPSRSKGPS